MNIVVCGLRDLGSGAGGVERGAEELNSRLASRGFDIAVYSCGTGPVIDDYRGFKLLRVPAAGGKYSRYFRYMSKAVRRIHETYCGKGIVHIHSPAVNGLWAYAFRRYGYRIVSHTHGIEWKALKWPPWFKLFMRWSERVAMRASDAVLCVSPHEYEYYRSLSPFSRGKCVLVRNGTTERPERTDIGILHSLGLQPGGYYLSVGRLVPQKRIMELMQAFAASHSPKKLVLVGSGSFSDRYVRTIERMSCSIPGVVLPKWLNREQVYTLYDGCFAFVQPSQHEGCPNALLEAMSCGCLCIVSDIEAHRDIEPDALIYVKQDVVRELVSIFQLLEANQDVYVSSKQRVMRAAQGLPTWDHSARTVEQVYESLLQERSGP